MGKVKYIERNNSEDKVYIVSGTFHRVKMGRKFTIIIEKDEEGWLVSEVVGLPGCHTQAKNMDQLLERTKEAIQAYLEDGEEMEVGKEFLGVQQIEV